MVSPFCCTTTFLWITTTQTRISKSMSLGHFEVILVLFHIYIRATKGKTNFDVPIRYTKFRWSNSFHRKIMFQNRFWTNQSLNSKYSLICKKHRLHPKTSLCKFTYIIYRYMLYNQTCNISLEHNTCYVHPITPSPQRKQQKHIHVLQTWLTIISKTMSTNSFSICFVLLPQQNCCFHFWVCYSWTHVQPQT